MARIHGQEARLKQRGHQRRATRLLDERGLGVAAGVWSFGGTSEFDTKRAVS